MKKNYTLIGHNLKHTVSPEIHSRLFQLSESNSEYNVTDISEDMLTLKYPELKRLSGYNITIPHKVKIIPLLEKLDESARRYGAVNCVSNIGGISTGFNTDAFGFVKALEAERLSLSGEILLLGFGGAGRVMAAEACHKGAKLTIAVREQSVKKVSQEALKIKSISPECKITVLPLDKISGEFSLLINSTPVGMYPHYDECPVSDTVIKRCENVFDAIYNPVETVLIKKARAFQKKAVGGMSMLIWQAVAAHQIWDNAEYELAVIQRIIKDMEEKVERDFR